MNIYTLFSFDAKICTAQYLLARFRLRQGHIAGLIGEYFLLSLFFIFQQNEIVFENSHPLLFPSAGVCGEPTRGGN